MDDYADIITAVKGMNLPKIALGTVNANDWRRYSEARQKVTELAKTKEAREFGYALVRKEMDL